jgi:gliding motility-associated-like protein
MKDGIPIAGATGSSLVVSEAGAYTATVFNGNCSGIAKDTAIITLSSLPSGTVSPAEATICEGEVQVLRATGGTSYQWYRDGVIINGETKDSLVTSVAGNYSVVIYSNNCSASARNTSSVRVNKPTGAISPANAAICPGASITLTTSGGDSYQWMRNGVVIPGATAATFTTSQPGSYQVRIFSGRCTGLSQNTVEVTAAPVPSGSITPAVDSICTGETKILKVTGGSSYQWYRDGTIIPGAVSDTLHANKAGRYSVIISNDYCNAPASNIATITVRAQPRGSSATFDVLKNAPYSLQARAGTAYQWTPATGLSDPSSRTPVVTTPTDIVYYVRVSQAGSCPVTDTIYVRAFIAPEIYVPNAFTPNNDGKNDVLRPVPVHIKTINYFRIVNRWGEVVFETNRIGDGWNGVFRGKPQPQGVFVWIFDGIDANGKRVTAKGTSVLIR